MGEVCWHRRRGHESRRAPHAPPTPLPAPAASVAAGEGMACCTACKTCSGAPYETTGASDEATADPYEMTPRLASMSVAPRSPFTPSSRPRPAASLFWRSARSRLAACGKSVAANRWVKERVAGPGPLPRCSGTVHTAGRQHTQEGGGGGERSSADLTPRRRHANAGSQAAEGEHGTTCRQQLRNAPRHKQ